MNIVRKWILIGNLYQIRNDLKAFNCIWIPEEKKWITPPMEKISPQFQRIRSMVEALDGEIYPADLSGQNKQIREILNNRR